MSADSRNLDHIAVHARFTEELGRLQQLTDRTFAILLLGQWVFAILCAGFVSPRTWVGEASSPHVHLWAAIVLGGVITSLPCWLVYRGQNTWLTRVVIASAQMSYSALLIHLMGGRIEAHFHIFGSLALLAFYRDYWVFLPAVVLTSVDHLVRGVFWPESVFGVMTPSAWRALEHAAWVLFETSFLLWGVSQSRRQIRQMTELQVELKHQRDQLEHRVLQRTGELAEERRLLETIINSLPHPVYWKSRDSLYLGCNQTFADYMGLDSPHEVVGMRDEDFGWSGEEAAFKRSEDQWIMSSGEEVHNAERRCPSADGLEHWVWVSKRPLLSENQGRFGLVAVLNDVTERRQAEIERDHLKSQLVQAQKLESIGQLAAGVAHEINTPMQFIGNNVEFLSACAERLFHVVDRYHDLLDCQEEIGWSQRRERIQQLTDECRFDHIRSQFTAAIEDSREGVKRTVSIVRAMRVFSHPGGQGMAPADINEAIQSTLAITRNRWKFAAEVELDLAADLPHIPVYESEINQVFLNLVVNASDAINERFEDSDERPGRIAIRSRCEAGQVVVEFEDNGMGIPEEIQASIFDPFFTTKEVGKGTGQGLSITHNVVVNEHGGQIEVSSEPGVGTVFTLRLPLEQPNNGATDPIGDSSELVNSID